MAPDALPKRRFRLLALDIDGTLVDRSLEITPRNLEALRWAVAEGIKVILATGRMAHSAMRYAQAIGTDEPMICYQGAVVAAPTGEFLHEWGLSPAAANRAVELARELDLHLNLYRDDRFYVERLDWGARRYAEIAQIEPVRVDDLVEIAAGGSTKAVFVAEPERLRELEGLIGKRMAPDARVTFSLPEFLESVSVDVSKARALEMICRERGIDASEVIAAGDAPNDVELFQYAGLAVAPTNAHEVALRAAGETMPPPGEDGIASLVERYLDRPATMTR